MYDAASATHIYILCTFSPKRYAAGENEGNGEVVYLCAITSWLLMDGARSGAERGREIGEGRVFCTWAGPVYLTRHFHRQ